MANVDGIVDASNGRGEGGGGVNKGVVDQMLDHERQVEVILGARLSAKTSGAFEYLVKWVGLSHIHNKWMMEDPLDQTAPAKFGEYILQYGRVPRMLADERWSKPQRIVAVHERSGGGGKSVAAAAAAAAAAEAAAEAAVTPGTRVAVEAPAPRRRTRPPARKSKARGEGKVSPPADSGGKADVNGRSPSPTESFENIRVLVKWWGLAYDACTWERVDVHPDLPKLLHLYRSWHRQSVEDRAGFQLERRHRRGARDRRRQGSSGCVGRRQERERRRRKQRREQRRAGRERQRRVRAGFRRQDPKKNESGSGGTPTRVGDPEAARHGGGSHRHHRRSGPHQAAARQQEGPAPRPSLRRVTHGPRRSLAHERVVAPRGCRPHHAR